MTIMMKTHTELCRFETFEERFDYLSLKSTVGAATFGFERYLNQQFYTSRQWRDVRHEVIARDMGRDLGIPGREIHGKIIIHHMNPMRIEDIENSNPDILDPELLITVTHETHNAIHYGDRSRLPKQWTERKPGDTLFWRQ